MTIHILSCLMSFVATATFCVFYIKWRKDKDANKRAMYLFEEFRTRSETDWKHYDQLNMQKLVNRLNSLERTVTLAGIGKRETTGVFPTLATHELGESMRERDEELRAEAAARSVNMTTTTTTTG